MKIVRAEESDLAAALRELSSKLSIRCGMVSPSDREKTVAVFGEALSPLDAVRRILRDVRERGDEGVAEYVRKLDGVSLAPDRFRVTADEISAAYEAASDRLKAALEKAAENIRRFQEHIKLRSPETLTGAGGSRISVRYTPLRRVGVYVPGGRAAYPSTVLMTAIPAQAAGVAEIAMATPCGPEGDVRPETLAAAHVAGVTEAYRVGGAQAIAALAYGTDTIPRVDKIVGPGNIYVTLAKREVYGEVDLDMLAGPSEVLIIAGRDADPRYVAADLLSQAEHDPAAAVLLTPDSALADAVQAEIEGQLGRLSRADAARECLERYGLIGVTRDLDHAAELADRFAPEHLELATADAEKLLPRIRSAGAVFLGPCTPEPVGDYMAGPSHVLPTGGTARFFSGLSVNDFLRRTSVMSYPREALADVARDVETIALAEGLDAHARAAAIRFEPETPK